MSSFDELNHRIVTCQKCPRLRAWCQKVADEKRKAFDHELYWGKPVPNFGDPSATGLILGLAPAAHGANRTGRMFTGDRSGDWLFRALFRAGLANQPQSSSISDGLRLNNVVITASCHCAPPDNKPTPIELQSCRTHLNDTLALNQYKAVLCLGNIAWSELHKIAQVKPRPKFFHGAESILNSGAMAIGSYHPSQQNTFTGRLTEEMLDRVMIRFASVISNH